MGRVTLDSSTLLAILNPADAHHDVVVMHLTGRADRFSISTITLVETLVYAYQQGSRQGVRYKALIDSAVKEIYPVDEKVALEASKLRSRTGLKTPDAIISATATLMGTRLWTLDKKLASAHKGAVFLG
ncbi:MAG: PIN domain-containing protein [Candidatus Nanopelagicaceae bacterium]